MSTYIIINKLNKNRIIPVLLKITGNRLIDVHNVYFEVIPK